MVMSVRTFYITQSILSDGFPVNRLSSQKPSMSLGWAKVYLGDRSTPEWSSGRVRHGTVIQDQRKNPIIVSGYRFPIDCVQIKLCTIGDGVALPQKNGKDIQINGVILGWDDGVRLSAFGVGSLHGSDAYRKIDRQLS